MTGGRPRSPNRVQDETAKKVAPERRRGAGQDRSTGVRNGQADRPSPDLLTVISSARAQLQELTGRPAEAVTSVERVQNGWRLSVEVVELERIPASTSILGGYDVFVDHDGKLLEYARIGRYHRNQAGEVDS